MFRAIDTHLTGSPARYAEPYRDYHGQAHIDTMLVGSRALGNAVVHIAAVEPAICCHAAIYDPTATDNEARSAALLPFRAGRARFLRAMLERRRLFLTDRFHLAYDAAARRNMEEALCQLEGESAQQ